MLEVRKSDERGVANFGWLDSKHTFSFGHYFDPKFLGVGPLRVINEDRVMPGGGFDTHGHQDMEIISYVLDGALEHKDSIGTGSVIRPGDVQRMTAGTGIRHSEFNHSKTEVVHFLQIWIVPEREGLEPGYEQKTFDPAPSRGALQLIASRDGRGGSLTIHQDTDLYVTRLAPGDEVFHNTKKDRAVWVQLANGSAVVGGERLEAGDGVAIRNVDVVELVGLQDAEILLFDMIH